jgi:cytochrome c553
MRLLLLLSSAVATAIGSAALAADSIEETAQICAGCHGEKGVPQEKTTPIIWGQNEGYLYLQLRDFHKGKRKSDIMGPIAATLSRDQMKALAAHFTQKPWPDLQQPSAPKDVAAKAVTTIDSIVCRSCHLDQFQGDGTTARLAGQQREYLEATMLAFRDRTRGNNPGMSDLMNAATPDDLKAVAQYLAGLQIIGGTYGR